MEICPFVPAQAREWKRSTAFYFYFFKFKDRPLPLSYFYLIFNIKDPPNLLLLLPWGGSKKMDPCLLLALSLGVAVAPFLIFK
jgi:hypothetical protein